MKWQVTALLVFACTCRAGAQAPSLPPIDTDRPDLTDGTGVMPRRMVQVEAGLTAQSARDGVTAWSVPELLVRVGVVRGAELRIGETWRSVGTGGTDRAEGLDDLLLGTKIALVPHEDDT